MKSLFMICGLKTNHTWCVYYCYIIVYRKLCQMNIHYQFTWSCSLAVSVKFTVFTRTVWTQQNTYWVSTCADLSQFWALSFRYWADVIIMYLQWRYHLFLADTSTGPFHLLIAVLPSKAGAPFMCLRSISVVLAASVQIHFWPHVTPFMHPCRGTF